MQKLLMYGQIRLCTLRVTVFRMLPTAILPEHNAKLLAEPSARRSYVLS